MDGCLGPSIRRIGGDTRRVWSCPHDCPCDAPKQRLQSQRQPSRLIREVKGSEGFTRKIKDVREADFRLANRSTPRVARTADNVGCEPPIWTSVGS